MHVTLRQLEYVIAVAEYGSFSKAAETCCAEQSTVSHQVKAMEDKLGISIFNRNTIPVKLSTEGELIVKQAKEIIAQVNELIKPFKFPVKKE
ncbi:MAG: LysR family transcriptional regulator [Cytophagales bacterium]